LSTARRAGDQNIQSLFYVTKLHIFTKETMTFVCGCYRLLVSSLLLWGDRRSFFEKSFILSYLIDDRLTEQTSAGEKTTSGTSVSSPIVTLPSGVQYQDLRRISRGDDDDIAVREGNRVNVQWVLKRSNGYLVDSSERNDGIPFIFVVGGQNQRGQPQAIVGLDQGVRGMKIGDIRRLIIPPQLSYVQGVEDGNPGPIPAGFGPKQRIRRVMELLQDVPGEAIVLEVKVTRIL